MLKKYTHIEIIYFDMQNTQRSWLATAFFYGFQ